MLTELLARLRRLSSDDRGFPLVEMLVAIVVLGVITVPIGNVVISALKHTDDTSSRLTESHDAQLSAAWFAQDVANFGTRDQLGDPLDPQLRQSAETNRLQRRPGDGVRRRAAPCHGPELEQPTLIHSAGRSPVRQTELIPCRALRRRPPSLLLSSIDQYHRLVVRKHRTAFCNSRYLPADDSYGR